MLCDKAFAKKLQATKQSEQLHMQTLTDTQQLEGFTCALKIISLDSDEEYSLTNVFVLEDIHSYLTEFGPGQSKTSRNTSFKKH